LTRAGVKLLFELEKKKFRQVVGKFCGGKLLVQPGDFGLGQLIAPFV
jgi:hypothetical protein